MDYDILASGPRVFISYAEPDEYQAERLVADLAALGIRAFFAPYDINPGENFPARLSRALADSDYYVLLVSTASTDRPWVEEEWAAALAREVNERRAFLFLLRLEPTPPPMLLSARHYLDAFADWDTAVQRLAEAWLRDWHTGQQGIHILPAPGLIDTVDHGTIGLYIFNKVLAVQHFMRVAPDLFGWQLYAQVRSALALQDGVSAIGGRVGLRFTYVLHHEDVPLSEQARLTQVGVHDGDSLDLTVTVESFGPNGTLQPVEYRHPDTSAPSETQLTNMLLRQAFGHLLPS